MNPNPFEKLSLCRPLLRALSEEGYEKPTDIQRETIPKVLAGNDLLATAQTGTGKTAAFALPILQRLDERRTGGARFIRVLVLTPTRELALQVASSFRSYGRHLKSRAAVILGGVPASPQIKALKKNPILSWRRPGACWICSVRGMSVSIASKRWFWTRPIVCWTWDSWTTFAGLCPNCPTIVRRCSSPPRFPGRLPNSPQTC